MFTKKRLTRLLQVLLPLLILAVWWVWSARADSRFYPPLQDILVRFRELWLFDHFVSDLLPSLGALALGFLVAAALGVLTGLLFALFPVLSELFSPVIHLYRAVPSVAVIPVFISLLGFGSEVRLLIIVLAAFPPTWIATMDGIRAVEPQLLDLSQVYRFTRAERVLGVMLPAATPQIFSGLQVSLQFSFVVMIATEMLGSTNGIGSMTILAQQSFDSLSMWAGILLLGIIGFLSNWLLSKVRAPLLRWYDESRRIQLAE